MPQKKSISVYRVNLVTVGIGQGQIETLPYLSNLTEYSPKGEILSQSNFTSNGLLAEKMAWDYDEKGQIIKQYYFAETDEPSETLTYERNEKGQVIREIKTYMDGSADTTTWEYDGEGQLLQKVTVDEDGVTELQEKFTWNGKQLLKHEIVDSEENIVFTDEFVYDDRGNMIEEKQVNQDTGDFRRKVSTFSKSNLKLSEKVYGEEGDLLESVVYHYDKSGKLISSEFESPQKCSTTVYRYEEGGTQLGQEETDEDGNQVLWVEHTYDEQKNRIRSTVFANGGTLSSSQHYELRYEYEWYEE